MRMASSSYRLLLEECGVLAMSTEITCDAVGYKIYYDS